MNDNLDWISRSCTALGLLVDTNFSVVLSDEVELVAVACIHNLGSEKGMLIFNDFGKVKNYINEINRLGYGFSVLEEPNLNESFDLNSFKDMFREWGWTGDESLKPNWMS